MLTAINPFRPLSADAVPMPMSMTMPLVQSIEDLKFEKFYVVGVQNLRALALSKEDVAWIGGSGGKIARTNDGGGTWFGCSIPEGDDLDIRALCVCSTNTVCAMSAGEGELSCVYRTSNAGVDWKLVLNPMKEGIFFNAMAFWDASHGILLSDPVNDRFVLFQTKDSGRSWQELQPLEMPFALQGESAFAASNSCLTVQGLNNVWFCTGGGASARVFHSSDQGLHWTVSTTPIQVDSPSSGLFSLSFLNANLGVAVGGDHTLPHHSSNPNIIITKDGGRNWEALNHTPLAGRYLSCATWVSANKILVTDESHSPLHSLSLVGRQGWAVGADQSCVKFSLN